MNGSRIGAAFAVLGLTTLAFAAAAVPQQSKGPTRAEILKAFKELSKQTEVAYPKDAFVKKHLPRAANVGGSELVEFYQGKGVPRFQGVSVRDATGIDENAQLMIKVWAVPLDAEGRLTNDKVNLAKRKWRPKQAMAIYFQSAIPVRVGFYQEFDATPNGQQPKPVRVLPDPKFPQSYKSIRPGAAFRFPVDIELDDTLDDELMAIVIVADGAEPDLSSKDQVDIKQTGETHLVFGKRYNEALERMLGKAKENKARFRSTARSGDGGEGEFESSTQADDVAVIGYGPDHYGYLQLRLTKKKKA
jgi:hypothetical protein